MPLLVALLIAIGLVGIIVPVLPGVLLVWGAILLWAATTGGTTAWIVFGVASLFLAVGAIVKFTVPGKRLKNSGVPNSTLFAGGVLGVVGFFVVPVLGLFAGFVLGVYLAETRRVGRDAAWPSSVGALKAVGLSMLIELLSALAATIVWVIGLFLV